MVNVGTTSINITLVKFNSKSPLKTLGIGRLGASNSHQNGSMEKPW